MIQAARAIVTQGNKMLVMKRNKFGSEYYTLVGGAVEQGEQPETALRRELTEESGVIIGEARLVYIEQAGPPYGTQYVFWCEYQGGEPHLHPESEEATISAAGKNTYEPMWLPIAELPSTLLRSGSIKAALIDAFQHGFPTQPKELEWRSEHEYHQDH